jgi:hypothetical protein
MPVNETNPEPSPKPAPQPETSFQSLVRLVTSYWPLLSSGTAVAIVVFFFGEARTAFENYVRSVVYPGLYSVADDKLKSTEARDRYIATAKYLRHIVIPSVEFPGSGAAQFERLDEIKDADAKYRKELQAAASRLLVDAEYKKELQNAVTKLLFDSENKTFDETLVAWFQRSVQTYIPLSTFFAAQR